jgi:hypothetical protein
MWDKSAAALTLVLLLGTAPAAAQQQQQTPPPPQQYPVFTADHLNEAMKIVGLAFGLANTAIAKSDFPLAKDYLARARDQLATTITFWRNRKIDEAIGILRTTLKQLDALDAALSADNVDGSAAAGRAKQAGASCQTCHAQYREQDPQSKAYRVRSDLLR